MTDHNAKLVSATTEQTGKPSVARTVRRNLKKKPRVHYSDIYGRSGIAVPSASLPALLHFPTLLLLLDICHSRSHSLTITLSRCKKTVECPLERYLDGKKEIQALMIAFC